MCPERATRLVVWGWVAHLLADFGLQNEWMATRKQSFTHPAAYVHAGIHTLTARLCFGWVASCILGALHLVVDQRGLMYWWRGVYRQTRRRETPVYIPFSMMQDQAAHVCCIALVALLVAWHEGAGS